MECVSVKGKKLLLVDSFKGEHLAFECVYTTFLPQDKALV